MIIKHIYDVVYDSLELLEEGGHTYSMDVNKLYKEMVADNKIINYSFVLNKETLTRTTTMTYADINAYEEHIRRFRLLDDTTVVVGRTVTNQYLEDEFGVKSHV